MITLLQYYSKTGYKIFKQTSFCNVNANKASSGLRENVILTNFGTKNMVGKFHTNMDEGDGEACLGGPFSQGT